MTASLTLFPSKASSLRFALLRSGYSGGNPKSGIPRLDDGGVFGVTLPPEGIIFEQWLEGSEDDAVFHLHH